jgi:hypothetical protein
MGSGLILGSQLVAESPKSKMAFNDGPGPKK